MGNNPVRAAQAARMNEPAQDTAPLLAKAQEAHERFLDDLAKMKREHRERIDAILKTIDERNIRDLKEKLKSI